MLKYKIPQIVTLTRINFRQSEQEESSVLYSSELCAELLYFWLSGNIWLVSFKISYLCGSTGKVNDSN